MKKKLICAILSISVLSSLMIGCGGGQSDSSADSTGTDQTEGQKEDSSDGDVTEITVWSWDAAVEDAIPAFEEANPDVKVNFENVGSASDQYSAIDNALQAGITEVPTTWDEYYEAAKKIRAYGYNSAIWTMVLKK